MSEYVLVIPQAASVSWIDHQRNPRTENISTGERGFDDPCEMASFIRGYVSETGINYNPTEEVLRLSSLDAACRNRPTPATVTQTTESPDPTVSPLPTELSDETPGEEPSINPPQNPSDPSFVDGDPPPDTLVAEQHDPRNLGEPDPTRPPEQRAFDPATPEPDVIVPTDQDPGGGGNNARERVLRNDPTPGLPHYEFGLNDSDESHVAADPVDLFSGTYGLVETDFELPGRRFPLLFRRRYRSGIPHYGPWGYGWDHNLNSYIRPLDDGYVAVWTGMINENVYKPNPDGSFEPPLGVVNRLVHVAAQPSSNETYEVITPDGSIWRYARPPNWPHMDRFPLVRFEDRFGNGHDYLYEPEGRLVRVSDGLGQHLEFAYGACELLESVTDHSGRTVRYDHDTDRMHLVRVVRPPTLESPDGASMCFEYDSFERHGRLRHNITRVIDEMGETKLQNVYEKDPSSDNFGRVVTQHYDCHRADFRYSKLAGPSRLANAINLPAWRVETLIDREYKVTTFNFRGNLLEERYRLVRDGSYRLFVRAQRFDKRGNLALTAMPNGLIRHFSYDVDNASPSAWSNLLQIDLQAPPSRPAPGRRIARMRYEDRFQLLTSRETESGAVTLFRYDHQLDPARNGSLVEIEHPNATLPDGTTQIAISTLSSNAHGQLETQTSPENRTIRYTYNARGLVSSVERDPGGLSLRTEHVYDDVGNAVELTDGEGNVTAFEFDARNRLVRAFKPEIAGVAPEINFTYYPTGQVATHIRPAGNAVGANGSTIETGYRYDVLGKLIERIDAAGTADARTTQYSYDAWDRLNGLVDSVGRETIHTYDERGRPLNMVRHGSDNEAREVRWINDINGMTTKVIFPDGSSESYDYDAWDRPLRVFGTPMDIGQLTTTLTFGDDELVLRVRTNGPDGEAIPDAPLAEHEFEYDERGRLVRQNAGLGDVVTWFDADGLQNRLVDPAGNETQFLFDAASRPSTIIDALDNQIHFILDREDRMTVLREEEPDPAGGAPITRVERREYNSRGEQISHTNLLGQLTKYKYDDAGRLSETVNIDGSIEQEFWNVHGELIELHRSFEGGSAISRVTRDTLGRITEAVDPIGSSTHLAYDAFDAVTQRTRTDGSVERFLYDSGGRLAEQRLASGSTVQFRHRDDGAVLNMIVTGASGMPPVPQTSFARDGLGRLKRASRGGSVIARDYDISGRTIADTLNGRSLTRTYDDNANVDWQVYGDGRRDRYERDEIDRVSSIVFEQAGVAATTGGLPPNTTLATYLYRGVAPTRREFASGVATSFNYNASLNLDQITHNDPAGNLIVLLDYGFSASGRRDSITASGAPWQSSDFAHDELGHLRQVQGVGRVDIYDVDAAGARQDWQRDIGGIVTRRESTTSARHQINSITLTDGPLPPVTRSFSYNADGALTSDYHRTYRVDGLGQVREIRRRSDNSLILSLDWDATGRLERVTRTNGESVDLHYFGNRLVEEVHSPSGNIVQHTPGVMPRECVARADGNIRNLLQDARGSAMALTTAAGTLEERRSSGVFGLTQRFNAAGNAILPDDGIFIANTFGGMHYLPDVGLYVSGPRLFDPETGMFLKADPLGLMDGTNEYSYCRHNPIDNVDSNGLWVESAWDIFSIGVGVASLTYNLSQDDVDWWAVGLDVAGIAVDVAALILPGVPGGASVGLKALRAANASTRVASRVQQLARYGRGVRYTQAAHGLATAGRGVYMSYEQAREGNYGTAAFGLGLSMVGIRGSLGRFQLARHADNLPSSLYSVQGDAGKIVTSGRIWGQTEGRVWASPWLGAGASKTGMAASDMPPPNERLVFEFSEGAQDVFSHHPVWGFFTGWKGIWGNQRITEIGDVSLDRFGPIGYFSDNIQNSGLAGWFVRITDASMIPPPTAHQALWRSRLRSAFPYAMDFLSNAIPGGAAFVLGQLSRDPNGASHDLGADRVSNGEQRQLFASAGTNQTGGPK